MVLISERTQSPASPACAICSLGQNLPDNPHASDPAPEDHAVHLHYRIYNYKIFIISIVNTIFAKTTNDQR